MNNVDGDEDLNIGGEEEETAEPAEGSESPDADVDADENE